MQSLDTTDLAARPTEEHPPPHSLAFHVVASPDKGLVGQSFPQPASGKLLARGAVQGLAGSLMFGRDVQEPGLTLHDNRVSRLHARADFDPQLRSFRLRDLQSRNGTFVNGQRVETALLTHGDVVRLGDTLLVYQEEDGMLLARQRLSDFARSELSVLLLGETGSGKEVYARELHALSGRQGEFLAVNCASLPRELIASELFGHARGAFSGAAHSRRGVIPTASGGTVLLDEVGDCPPDVQAALLRVLQEKAVRPVGTERELPVDVRFVAATHRSLEEMVERGTFRADLYARLSQVKIALPPLRERKNQLLTLSSELAEAAGGSLSCTPDAAEALLAWNWPFNVRELDTLVRTALVVRGPQALVDLDYLRAYHPELVRGLSASPSVESDNKISGEVGPSEPRRLRALLSEHRGNVSEVARSLGKPRSQVYRWMKAAGTAPNKFRA